MILGTCVRTNEEPYGGCSCPPEFSGPTCSNDPCTPSPCLNGGYCIRKPDNQFYCQCRNKNKGVYCEREFSFRSRRETKWIGLFFRGGMFSFGCDGWCTWWRENVTVLIASGYTSSCDRREQSNRLLTNHCFPSSRTRWTSALSTYPHEECSDRTFQTSFDQPSSTWLCVGREIGARGWNSRRLSWPWESNTVGRDHRDYRCAETRPYGSVDWSRNDHCQQCACLLLCSGQVPWSGTLCTGTLSILSSIIWLIVRDNRDGHACPLLCQRAFAFLQEFTHRKRFHFLIDATRRRSIDIADKPNQKPRSVEIAWHLSFSFVVISNVLLY